jgi:hypothetical protein
VDLQAGARRPVHVVVASVPSGAYTGCRTWCACCRRPTASRCAPSLCSPCPRSPLAGARHHRRHGLSGGEDRPAQGSGGRRRAPSVPPVDQGLAALMGAFAGAGGAVLAQIVAARYAGKRDERRFSWERARASQLDERDRRRSFAEVRRESYFRLLGLLEVRYDDYSTLLTGPASGGGDPEELRRRLNDSTDEYDRATKELLAEIALLAPRVHGPGLSAASALLIKTSLGAEQLHRRLDSAQHYRRVLHEAMRVDLGLEVEDPVEGGQTGES